MNWFPWFFSQLTCHLNLLFDDVTQPAGYVLSWESLTSLKWVKTLRCYIGRAAITKYRINLLNHMKSQIYKTLSVDHPFFDVSILPIKDCPACSPMIPLRTFDNISVAGCIGKGNHHYTIQHVAGYLMNISTSLNPEETTTIRKKKKCKTPDIVT